MNHPLEAFASSLDLDASKVINSPSIIFLCGGPIETKPKNDPSLRALFYERLKRDEPGLLKQVLLAEKANLWSKNPEHYDNLFELENDLAYLSAVILLFVESAGSIAELGAFCQAPALRKKLVAILEESYWEQQEPSFIRDGPVAFLEKLEQKDKKFVLVYDWLRSDTGDGRRPLDLDRARNALDKLLDWLSGRVEDRSAVEAHHKETFRKTNRGHILLLLADLIDLGSVVQVGEITSVLNSLGISLGRRRLNRYLFLLGNLNLIHKTKVGHREYYLAGTESDVYVHYAYKLDDKHKELARKAWERLRVQLDLRDQLWRLDPERKPIFGRHLEKSGK